MTNISDGSTEDIRLFKALADPTRLHLVKILLNGERCACELPSMVGKAQPTVSLQLKKLVSYGCLSFRKDGVKVLYRITEPKIPRLIAVMGSDKSKHNRQRSKI